MRLRATTLPLAALLSGCSLVSTADEVDCSLDRPAVVLSPPQVAPADEGGETLGLDVTSSAASAVRATVTINGKLAFDGRLPRSGGCAHAPVQRYRYSIPRGPAVVAVSTDRGEKAAATVMIDGATRWVVVQIYDGLPLQVTPYDAVPGWA